MPDLHQTQERITNWFASRASEVLLHANIKEVADSEKTLIFHHEQLKKSRKRASILKLTNQEGNLVEGHRNCASVLQEEARVLLDNPSILDSKAQEELLSFVDEVFTEADKPTQKVVLYETDYVSAYDLMSIDWILKVLLKKGCSKSFVQTLRNIFQDEDTYVSCVVNNEVQERILNRRKNIKQGCRSSTLLYCFATDPLLIKLNKILKGLTYFSHPTAGPHHPLFGRPRPVVEKITAIGYVDLSLIHISEPTRPY